MWMKLKKNEMKKKIITRLITVYYFSKDIFNGPLRCLCTKFSIVFTFNLLVNSVLDVPAGT